MTSVPSRATLAYNACTSSLLWYLCYCRCSSSFKSLKGMIHPIPSVPSHPLSYSIRLPKPIMGYVSTPNDPSSQNRIELFQSKTVLFEQKSALIWLMVCITYYTVLSVQICNYAQKQRICRRNSKHALYKCFRVFFALAEMLPTCATPHSSQTILF